MSGETAFRLVQGLYYLALGTWFGAMVMLIVGAAVTFRTVRAFEPSLGAAPFNHPDLAQRAAPILAGGVTGNHLRALAVIQGLCAVVVLGALVLQSSLFRDRLASGLGGGANLLRVALVLVPVVVLAADRLVVTPAIWEQRDAMYNPQNPPEVREAAHARFLTRHSLSTRLMGLSTVSLAAAVLASPFAFAPGVRP